MGWQQPWRQPLRVLCADACAHVLLYTSLYCYTSNALRLLLRALAQSISCSAHTTRRGCSANQKPVAASRLAEWICSSSFQRNGGCSSNNWRLHTGAELAPVFRHSAILEEILRSKSHQIFMTLSFWVHFCLLKLAGRPYHPCHWYWHEACAHKSAPQVYQDIVSQKEGSVCVCSGLMWFELVRYARYDFGFYTFCTDPWPPRRCPTASDAGQHPDQLAEPWTLWGRLEHLSEDDEKGQTQYKLSSQLCKR